MVSRVDMMNKKILRYAIYGGIFLIAFALGLCIKSMLTPSIAVVRLRDVLSQSNELTTLRKENDQKLHKLSLWLDEVSKEIDSEKNKQKREKLVRQYQDIAREKESLIKEGYARKLEEIDIKMTELITRIAHQKGCNIVLTNTSVIAGATDITEDVLKEISKK